MDEEGERLRKKKVKNHNEMPSTVCELILDEFQVKRISLKHKNLADFLCSQWQLPSEKSIIYVVYKWIVAFTYFAILVNSMAYHAIYKGTLDYYFLNLTNWGCLVNAIYACLGAGLVAYHNLRRNLSERHQMPCVMKFYWLLYYVSINNSFVVTTLYWGLVYKPNDEKHKFTVNNFLVHVINLVVIMIELFVSAIPFRILHVIYPIVFETVYTLFTVVYYYIGGVNVEGEHYIYKALDWSIPEKTIWPTIGAFTMMTIMHCIYFVINQLKIYVHHKRRSYNEIEKLQNGSSDSSEIK